MKVDIPTVQLVCAGKKSNGTQVSGMAPGFTA